MHSYKDDQKQWAHAAKKDRSARLVTILSQFRHYFVEISVTISIIMTVVCGSCANIWTCGCSLPMSGHGESYPNVPKACMHALGPAWAPVWPAWWPVWAACKPVRLAGRPVRVTLEAVWAAWGACLPASGAWRACLGGLEDLSGRQGNAKQLQSSATRSKAMQSNAKQGNGKQCKAVQIKVKAKASRYMWHLLQSYPSLESAMSWSWVLSFPLVFSVNGDARGS